ncbi:MAG: SLBB domain-containing protein [Candidatus Latescibacteria bacterium]|nr:SLBB domain-containing protein [Candidatus Latescibacterota bacterium]MCK5525902.1 SLBB domain-containing protein [Candidatus Latescibacterota bacterium]MCK5734304.1 SLBB domain-containing protein [Candidatus Latescibacterota bacterium]
MPRKIIFLGMITILLLGGLWSLSWGQGEKIEVGDVINIVVYEHEELTKQVPVLRDGTIDFPFVEDLPVVGITLDQLKEVIGARLSRYTGGRPLVMVSFAEAYAIHVAVLGFVRIPGVYEVPVGSTIQGALASAGGALPRAELEKVKVVRGEDDAKQEHLVDLQNFLEEGKVDFLVRDRDVVIVPGTLGATTVKVLGGVRNPGSYETFPRANIFDMIFAAGGPSEDAAVTRIRLISPGGQTRDVNINIKELLHSENKTDIPLVFPGDIIFVPEKLVSWKKLIGVARDLSVLVTMYYFLTRE